MASLYSKDPQVNQLAEQLATARGLTKAAAVKHALQRALKNCAVEPAATRRDSRAMIDEFRREKGWMDVTGYDANNAFFDSLHER